MKFKGIYLLLSFLIFTQCSKHNVGDNAINAQNLNEKIEQAYLALELNDNKKPLISLLFYIDKNNVDINDPCVLSKVLYLMAIKNYTLDEQKTLLSHANAGLLAAEKCDDYAIKVSINNLLGIVYYNNKKYSKSIEYYKKAIYLAKKKNKEKNVIDTYYSLCLVESDRKFWKEVISSAKQGIAIINKANFKKTRLKYFYLFLAEAYTNQENYYLAETYLKEAKTLTEQSKLEGVDHKDVLKSYREIYLIYAQLNKKQQKFDIAYNYMKSADSIIDLNVKSDHKNMRLFLDTEINLENKLDKRHDDIIIYDIRVIVGSSIFLLISIFFIYRIRNSSRNLKNVLKEKENLNEKLATNLNELEEVNNKLTSKNKEIKSLLKRDENILLSKTFKLSVYKDGINNIIKHINKLIEDKESVKSNTLHSVNRSLHQVISEEDIWGDFKIEFEKNKLNFFDNLLKVCPTLTIIEQKHCAYVCVNLKSKEVASILNLSPRSVETARYRLKKKFNLEKKSLQEFLEEISQENITS